jgi:predicted ATP-grasp superfamily ATP-dependent carboligase
MFTNNNVVFAEGGFIGNISYQITGLWPFTDRQFATVGNDWNLPEMMLTLELEDDYKEMVIAIGNKLRRSGWKGLFGIDVVLDKKNKKLFLIEINARQPASTTYESQLQLQQKGLQAEDTIFGEHLLSLLNQKKLPAKEYDGIRGAQIVLKVTPHNQKAKKIMIAEGKKLGWNVIPYINTEPETDLLRIQLSPDGIVRNPLALEELQEKSRTCKKEYLKSLK